MPLTQYSVAYFARFFPACQIRGLVDRLLQSVKEKLYASNADAKRSSQPSSSSSAGGAAPTGTVMFKRAAIPTTESELATLDLNVVSDVSDRPHLATVASTPAGNPCSFALHIYTGGEPDR
jgi:hypothetical protein